MDSATLCYEWMDNRDEILKLYEANVENARKIYPIVADGPLTHANYGGNVEPSIIGRQNFIDYYIPHYQEAAEVLHRKGKLIGTHLDSNNETILDVVGDTDLDYIEAYDAGISPPVGEAKKVLKNKILWLNWPSAWHLMTEEEVYEKTQELLFEAAPEMRLLIGITEDVPEHRWQGNFLRIMDAIDDF